MIFFFDLDRTLIYSKRFINSADEKVVLVEQDGEEEIAFMTVGALEIFKELAATKKIIPVTTRNYNEYKRIRLLNEVDLEYSIINNGAEILHHGVREKEYCSMIKCEIGQLSYGFQWSLQKFLEYFDRKYIKLYRLSDDFLWVIVMNTESFDRSLILKLGEEISSAGWSVSATGKKIYLIPKNISKWRAVSYLKEKFQNEPIICAGDSFMDKEMVENADFGIVPLQSELAGMLPNVRSTSSPGIKSGEEILLFVKDIFKKI